MKSEGRNLYYQEDPEFIFFSRHVNNKFILSDDFGLLYCLGTKSIEPAILQRQNKQCLIIDNSIINYKSIITMKADSFGIYKSYNV